MSVQASGNYYPSSQPQQFAGLPSLFSGTTRPRATTSEGSVYEKTAQPEIDNFTPRYNMPTDSTWAQGASGDGWYESMRANLSTGAGDSARAAEQTVGTASTWEAQMARVSSQRPSAPLQRPSTWDDMAASALVSQTVDRTTKPMPFNPLQSPGYQKLMGVAQAIHEKRNQVNVLSPEARELAQQHTSVQQAANRALIADQIDRVIPAESELGSLVRQIVADALQHEPESPKFGQIMGQLTLLATKLPQQSAQLDEVAIVVKDATMVRLQDMLKESGGAASGRIAAIQLERESLANRKAINQFLSSSNPALNALRGVVGEIFSQQTIDAQSLDSLESQFVQVAAKEPFAKAIAPKLYLLVLDTAVNQQLLKNLQQGDGDIAPLKTRKALISELYKQPNLTFEQLGSGMEKAPEYTAKPTGGFDLSQMMMMMALAKA